jgi:hypothetical protein
LRSPLSERGTEMAHVQQKGIVIGYGWGHIGQRGQYWADLLWDSLPERIASEWGLMLEAMRMAPVHPHEALRLKGPPADPCCRRA